MRVKDLKYIFNCSSPLLRSTVWLSKNTIFEMLSAKLPDWMKGMTNDKEKIETGTRQIRSKKLLTGYDFLSRQRAGNWLVNSYWKAGTDRSIIVLIKRFISRVGYRLNFRDFSHLSLSELRVSRPFPLGLYLRAPILHLSGKFILYRVGNWRFTPRYNILVHRSIQSSLNSEWISKSINFRRAVVQRLSGT